MITSASYHFPIPLHLTKFELRIGCCQAEPLSIATPLRHSAEGGRRVQKLGRIERKADCSKSLLIYWTVLARYKGKEMRDESSEATVKTKVARLNDVLCENILFTVHL